MCEGAKKGKGKRNGKSVREYVKKEGRDMTKGKRKESHR